MNNKIKLTAIGILFAVSIFLTGYFYAGVMKDSKVVLPEIGSEKKEKSTENVEVKKDVFSAQADIPEGKVEILNPGTNNWEELENGKDVISGSQLRTLADTKLVLKFEDGSEARFRENSIFNFDLAQNEVDISIEEGEVYNDVVKDLNRKYSVSAGSYSFNALGTVFNVSKKKSEEAELVTLENEVEIKNSKGDVIKKIPSGKVAKVKSDKVSETDLTKSKLKEEFISWNIKKDGLKIEGKDDVTQDISGKLNLSAKATKSKVELKWEVKSLGDLDGFKIVKSKEKNPVYPGSEYKYITDKEARSAFWEIKDGDEYHFRICQYKDGKCLSYSNDVVPKMSDDDDEEDYADEISLSVEKDGDDAKLKWKISGGDAPNGFKLVSSTDKNPEYPNDDWKYVDDSSKRSYTWKDFKEGKTYHFRVCIYKDGKCKKYSNDEKIEF